MCLLLAIGGHVGTGKTTLAYALRKNSPYLKDSSIIEDDQIRREVLGVDLSHCLGQDAYSEEVSAKVSDEIESRTIQALRDNISVINSSGFFSERARESVQKLAEGMGKDFVGIWLVASPETMKLRIEKRVKERRSLQKLALEQGHASDADEKVIEKFGDIGVPKSPEWTILDAACSQKEVLSAVLARLNEYEARDGLA